MPASSPHALRVPGFLSGILAVLFAGCTSTSRDSANDSGQTLSPGISTCMAVANDSGHAVSTGPHASPPPSKLMALLAGTQLERQALINTVLDRNPSIVAAHDGWQAALARYPQQTSWDDPLVTYRAYPFSIGHAGVPYGQEIEISQHLPLGGKLELAGDIARAEADAAKSDYQSVRIRLAMMASLIYDAYGLAVRSLAITTSHLKILADLQESARARVASGKSSIQDPLQAEAEIAELHEEQITLEADRDIAIAQLNGLLHRLPIDAVLPVPNADDEVAEPGHESAALQEIAVKERPELIANSARSRRSASALSLAQEQYLPDIAVTGSYSSLWDQHDYRYGVGITVALPVHTDRLQGGIDEAAARLAEARSDQEHMERDIRVEVHQALRRVAAADATAALVHDHLIPAVSSRVDAARSSFETGQGSFADLIGALRALRTAELRQADVHAEVSRRRATLFQTLGRIPSSHVIGQTP